VQKHWPKLDRHEPVTYRICIQGTLDEDWADYIGAQSVSVEGGASDTSVTTLISVPVDQAALIGTINYLTGLGALLLSVEYLPAGR